MKVSSRARDAVRLVLEVARRGGTTTPVRLAEIAKVMGISRASLEQLAVALKCRMLVRGISGHNGGYVLARAADQITIGDVLHAVSGPTELASCALDGGACTEGDACECGLMWLVLKQRIDQALEQYTFADMLGESWAESVREEILALTGEPSSTRMTVDDLSARQYPERQWVRWETAP